MRGDGRSPIVVLALAAMLVPFAPAAAESAEHEWTQTSQFDFLQGSGSADVLSSPGDVVVGPDLPTDTARWTTVSGANLWSWRSAPYVLGGEGSLYGGRQVANCAYCRYTDSIGTSAVEKDSITLYLLPAGGTTYRYHAGAFAKQYLRLTDGSYTEDHLLRGVESTSWSSTRELWGDYDQVVSLNGWSWYKFTIDVPAGVDRSTLRAELLLDISTQAAWSCYCYVDLYNYIAFGLAEAATFTSNAHHAGGLARIQSVSYSGTVPSGSALALELRTSGDGESFTPWTAVLSGERPDVPVGRFIQYRALLTPEGRTGIALHDVTVRYDRVIDVNPPRTVATIDAAVGCDGWLVTRPIVTLTAEDDVSGVAATQWGFDGSILRKYGAPFALPDGVHDIRYFSIDYAGNEESTRALHAAVDTRAPVTGLGVEGPWFTSDRVYVSEVTSFALDARDATSGVASTLLDTGAGAAEYGGAFSFTGDGARAVSWSSVDHACNLEASRGFGAFVDATPPSLDVVTPAAISAHVLGNSSSEAPAFDDAKDRVARFGLSGSDVDYLSDLMLDAAADACGPAEASACAALAIAGLAPRAGGAVVVGNVTVRADADDPEVAGGASRLARVEFRLDGELRAVSTAAPHEWLWDATEDAAGRHDLVVIAVDNVGNEAVVERGVTVVPTTLVGAMESGAFALGAAGAPQFAHAFYDLVREKVEGFSPPEAPIIEPPEDVEPPIDLPDDIGPPEDLVPPIGPPEDLVPPIGPPDEVPAICIGSTCISSDDVPEIPQVCVDDFCVPPVCAAGVCVPSHPPVCVGGMCVPPDLPVCVGDVCVPPPLPRVCIGNTCLTPDDPPRIPVVCVGSTCVDLNTLPPLPPLPQVCVADVCTPAPSSGEDGGDGVERARARAEENG